MSSAMRRSCMGSIPRLAVGDAQNSALRPCRASLRWKPTRGSRREAQTMRTGSEAGHGRCRRIRERGPLAVLGPVAGRMPGARLALALTVVLAVALSLSLAACSEPPSDPEIEIRAAIEAAEAAAEAGEYDLRAGRDRPRLLLMIRGLLMRYPRLEIIVTLREVRVLSPELARVRLDVLGAGAGAGRGGFSADAFPLELSLRRERGQWRITRAEWGRDL